MKSAFRVLLFPFYAALWAGLSKEAPVGVILEMLTVSYWMAFGWVR